jgi:peptide/nickel transport system permease protein
VKTLVGRPVPIDAEIGAGPAPGAAILPPALRRGILGRILWPVIEQRRTLTGIMTFVGLGFLLSFVTIALAAPLISPYDPLAISTSELLQPPSAAHLMGTDHLGRDVLSRVFWGARTSLMIMAIGVFVALLVGVPLGLTSGYVGGLVDRVLVLVMDSIYSFPGLLLAMALAAILGRGVVNIGIAITVIYVPLYFRVVRNHTVAVKQEVFVEAARALGARPASIISRYITFNVISSIPVIFSVSAADAILTAAGLSFIGLGVDPPTPDWGADLATAQQWLPNDIWWTSVFPGFMILLLTVGLSMLGEGVNDIVNPLLRRTKT